MSRELQGLLLGVLAVAAFSLSLIATRLVVASIDVWTAVLARAIGAGLLAAVVLVISRQPWPTLRDCGMLGVVAGGVVLGFPLFTSYAMTSVPASHGAVVVGLLPLATTVVGVVLGGERPSLAFWGASLGGTLVILAFVADSAGAGGPASVSSADLALIAAVISAAIGYGVGGRLAKRLGGWQVISWALVLSLPPLSVASLWLAHWPTQPVSMQAWVGLAYITVVSQYLGFFAWYRGLALGGIARVSQTQLLQLFFTLAAAGLFFGERIDPHIWIYGTLVAVIAGLGTRLRADTRMTARA